MRTKAQNKIGNYGEETAASSIERNQSQNTEDLVNGEIPFCDDSFIQAH